MSAINIAVIGRAAYMLTDTLGYSFEGEILGFGAKALTLPHSRTVIACRGPAVAHFWASNIAGYYGSFDETVEKLPGALREQWAAVLASGAEGMFEVFAMGYSDAQNQIIAFGLGSEGEPLFEPVFSPVWIAPDMEADDLRAGGVAVQSGGIVFGDIPADLLRIMEAQRARKPSSPEDRIEIIGGHAVLTVLTKETITQRIVRRWE